MKQGKFQNITNMDEVLFVDTDKVGIYSIAQKSETPVELYDKLKNYFGPDSFGIHTVVRGLEGNVGIRKGYQYQKDKTFELLGYYAFVKKIEIFNPSLTCSKQHHLCTRVHHDSYYSESE
jgi:hypothetical protein